MEFVFIIVQSPTLLKSKKNKRLKDMNLFVKGNDAVVIGALYAGCEAYFGYPITPASEIAHSAANWFPQTGRVFLQAECETNSIYMVYGQSFFRFWLM